MVYLLISAFTVGLGFLIHEMGHKFVAQKYGCFAEFRANMRMLVLAVMMSFLGFVFVAPGAVYIHGNLDHKKNGKIAAAGPLMNIILAVIFLIIMLFFSKGIIVQYGFMINSWLALFNMIPFMMFDGLKILRWNKVVYGVMVGVCVIMVNLMSFLKL